MTRATGWRTTADCPRSPVAAEVSHSHRPAANDRSAPRLARDWSSVSGEAESPAVPAYALTGWKGDAAATANIPNVTTRSTGAAISTRHPVVVATAKS